MATMPVEVDGVVYAAAGYSVIHAVDVRSGKLLWKYDPNVGIRKMRMAWGIRGLTYWNGKIYAGVQDGRMFALDAKTGAMEIGRASGRERVGQIVKHSVVAVTVRPNSRINNNTIDKYL